MALEEGIQPGTGAIVWGSLRALWLSAYQQLPSRQGVLESLSKAEP